MHRPNVLDFFCITHGRIIKWTQHIGFLTLVRIAGVVERNHVNDSKRRIARILHLLQFGEI